MAITNAVSRNVGLALIALTLAAAPGVVAEAIGAPGMDREARSTVALDRDGALLAVSASGGEVRFFRSVLHEAPPGDGVLIATGDRPIDHNGESRPKIALGVDGEIYVSFTRRIEGRFAGDVIFTRSLDGGRTFEEPRPMRDTAGPTSHRFDAMQVTPSGLLYVVWIDKRDLEAAAEAFHGASVYYAVSDDGGASFGPNRVVAHHSCECCRLALAPAGDDRVRVLWRHVFDGSIRDHALATLGPEAASSPVRATFDDWELHGCPHAGPHMAAGADGLHLAWVTGAAGAAGVYYGYYDPDTGLTTRVRRMDERPGAGQPQVAVRGGRVDFVWQAATAEGTALLHAVSMDGGRSWSAERRLGQTGGHSDHPQLVQRDDSLVAVWFTRNEGMATFELENG